MTKKNIEIYDTISKDSNLKGNEQMLKNHRYKVKTVKNVFFFDTDKIFQFWTDGENNFETSSLKIKYFEAHDIIF